MKKNAFTLSEVLITLGIIGVVAALTMPSLYSGYQKRILTSLLQKTVAELSQAGAIALSDEIMTSNFKQLKAVQESNFLGKYLKGSSGNRNEFFAATYGFADNKNATYNFRNEVDVNCSCKKLNSGASVCINGNGKGIMDINGGNTGPNLVGRDAFSIGFSADGSLSSEYSLSLDSIIYNGWDIDNPDFH